VGEKKAGPQFAPSDAVETGVVEVVVVDVVVAVDCVVELVHAATISVMATIATITSLRMMVMAHIGGRAGRWQSQTPRW
jgi:hypothetical protein